MRYLLKVSTLVGDEMEQVFDDVETAGAVLQGAATEGLTKTAKDDAGILTSMIFYPASSILRVSIEAIPDPPADEQAPAEEVTAPQAEAVEA